jgi:hypothetical protein
VRRRLVGLGVAGALVVLLTGTQAGALASFGDATGDHGKTETLIAPDIGGVQVSNTPDGVITFRVAIENYSELPPRSRIVTLFDLDRDVETAELGFERAVSHLGDATGPTRVVFEQWDEPSFGYVQIPASTITSSFSGGVYTMSISRSELGNTAGFNFALFTILFGENQRDRVGDIAPNENRWSYDLVGLPSPTLSTARVIAMPARPLAGKTFTIAALVRRSDTGGALSAASVSCTARVGQARVRAVGRFSEGRARCVVSVPRNAKGKTLRGTLTVRAAGARLTRAFSYRVR